MKNLILIIAALVLLNVTGFSQEYDSLNFKIVNRDTLIEMQSKLAADNPNLEFTITTIGYLDATDFDLDYILGSIQKRTMPTNNKKAYQGFENRYAYDINLSTKLEEVYVSYYTDYEIIGLPMLLVTILYGNDFTPNFEEE